MQQLLCLVIKSARSAVRRRSFDTRSSDIKDDCEMSQRLAIIAAACTLVAVLLAR